MQIDKDQIIQRISTPKTTARSERDELIQRFADHGTIKVRDRKTGVLTLASARQIAMLLSHVPTADLHPFYRQCEQARSFSRYFWWAIRPPS